MAPSNPQAISVTCFTDPGCPWGYSANPDLAVLHWRYRDQLRWRFVMIGIYSNAKERAAVGYTPEGTSAGNRLYRRFGMPISTHPRPGVMGTERACRAVVATRLLQPDLELPALRALQMGFFATGLTMDEDAGILESLSSIQGLNAAAVVAALDDDGVKRAYTQDWSLARTAVNSASDRQGKAHSHNGTTRYTAPTLIFETDDGRRLEAGGFQSIEVYDAMLANLGIPLERHQPARNAVEVVRVLPFGPTTAEVAACMAVPLAPINYRDLAEDALVAGAVAGDLIHTAVGDDAVWSTANGIDGRAQASSATRLSELSSTEAVPA